jgi:hypothetical protein
MDWGAKKIVRALREITSSTSGGSEGGVVSVDSGDLDTEGFFVGLLRRGVNQ